MNRHRFKRGGYISQAWLVLMLATVFGGTLAGVHIALQPRVEQNKLNETYKQVDSLVPDADRAKTEELVLSNGKIAYKALDSDGKHVGWVIKAAGQGFADKIELLIGLDADAEAVTGMYVLDQKETPGLGNKITEDKWRGQFAGKKAAEPLTVVKRTPVEGKNEVEAVSGATISSRSVCRIVNAAVKEFKDFEKSHPSELKKKD